MEALEEAMDDIGSINFDTANINVEKTGSDHEQYIYLRSGILYALAEFSEKGVSHVTREMILKESCRLLDVEDNLVSMALDEMINSKDIIIEKIPGSEEKAIYLPILLYGNQYRQTAENHLI